MGSIIGPPPSTRRGQRGTPTWSACWRPPAQPPTGRIMLPPAAAPPPRQPPTPPRRGAGGTAAAAPCSRPARILAWRNHVLQITSPLLSSFSVLADTGRPAERFGCGPRRVTGHGAAPGRVRGTREVCPPVVSRCDARTRLAVTSVRATCVHFGSTSEAQDCLVYQRGTFGSDTRFRIQLFTSPIGCGPAAFIGLAQVYCLARRRSTPALAEFLPQHLSPKYPPGTPRLRGSPIDSS